jgi:hypothetical protein
MKVEAGTGLGFARVNLRELTSEGRIDAADSVAPAGRPAGRSGAAHSLDLFDQAHLRRAFSALVGQSSIDDWRSQRNKQR